MILNKEKECWHYLAVKKLSALLRGITIKRDGDFYCLNCRTKNKLKFHKIVCEKKHSRGIVMSYKKHKISSIYEVR